MTLTSVSGSHFHLHRTVDIRIRACATEGNFAFALTWKMEMEKLGVQPYFTTYVYLIALGAEAKEWAWVDYLLAEVAARPEGVD